jgi:hypothetical protein
LRWQNWFTFTCTFFIIFKNVISMDKLIYCHYKFKICDVWIYLTM